MDEVPTKCYWMGEDIDTLPAERLREIVRQMGREIESIRDRYMRDVNMMRDIAAARSRF